MNRILDVYLHDQMAGKLIQEKNGRLLFQYDTAYVTLPDASPLSLSMPLRYEVYEEVKSFFSGLLPDDIVRHRLAQYLGVSEKNPFALLEIIGGECAGALSLFPEGYNPPLSTSEEIEILSDQKLEEILDLLKRRPLLVGQDTIRLSLAGAQDKIAIRLVNDFIGLAKGTTPTSHILKPMIEGFSDSVQNEYFCLTLAKKIGIDTPHVEIRYVGKTPYFLIERYDRVMENGHIKRYHQEDFCQALGILPELKYEREGGPSLHQCLSLLKEYSERPALDSMAFIKIGNSDAHGKNFSLLYKKRTPALAPCYDLMSTSIYPSLSKKMAMKIGGSYDPEKVFLRHWHQIIPDTLSSQKMLHKELQEISENCLVESKKLRDLLKRQGNESIVFDQICSLIAQRTRYILDSFFP